MLVFQSVSGEWMISWNYWISRIILLYQSNVDKMNVKIPIPSMYDIFTYMWSIFMVNAGKYTIHGWYGIIHPDWNHLCSTRSPKWPNLRNFEGSIKLISGNLRQMGVQRWNFWEAPKIAGERQHRIHVWICMVYSPSFGFFNGRFFMANVGNIPYIDCIGKGAPAPRQPPTWRIIPVVSNPYLQTMNGHLEGVPQPNP